MIYQAGKGEIKTLLKLALSLWKGHTPEDLRQELTEVLETGGVFFIAVLEEPVGFAQCQLRHDYVEGTHSSPVGYLEGIFVKEAFQKQGIGTALLKACEQWAASQGCREFASDCELENETSRIFHQKMGFTEANRIICFTKEL